MKMLLYLSDYIIPLFIFYVVGFGILMKVGIYDEFVKGAAEGFKVVLDIMPTLIGLMVGVSVLRASGTLEIVADFLEPVMKLLHFPAELFSLVLVKIFSSSAATGLALDIFKEYGPDSYLGRLTSVIMSSTETVFYTMSVYFMAAGVKKTRYTLAGALLATLAGIVASVVLVGMMSH